MTRNVRFRLPDTRLVTVIAVCVMLLTSCDDSRTQSSNRVDSSGRELPSWVTDEMIASTVAAIERSRMQGEVPVGAVCVVGTTTGRRLFSGWNTTREDAAGHAEVNALQRALESLGPEGLSDPDSVWLLTSFEPCPMCAALLGDVRGLHPEHVAIMLPKTEEWRLKEARAVEEMKRRWTYTGLDSIQLDAFCRDARFRSRYPRLCQ